MNPRQVFVPFSTGTAAARLTAAKPKGLNEQSGEIIERDLNLM